jgi:DNA mismatch repair protein MutS
MNTRESKNNLQGSAPTPMMVQYHEIKAVNPDCLLFYRMGDFYEMFFDDAVTAATALDITLTKRGRHQGKDIPMCGVPVHAADGYLQTLIRKGFKVAVCEQTENPTEAKKRGAKAVVHREVTRLVTRGTITEDALLDARQANNLLAIARARSSGTNNFAIAWSDISTGSLFSMELGDLAPTFEIERLEPREIILPENLKHSLNEVANRSGAIIAPLSALKFDSVAGLRQLKHVFNVTSLDGFGEFSKSEIGALGALIGYIEITQCGKLPVMRPPVRIQNGRYMLIDQATRSNLELVRTLSGEIDGSLLFNIDRTLTGTGARALARRLRSPSTDVDEIGRWLDALTHFANDQRLRTNTRDVLKTIPDMLRPLSRLSLTRGGPRDLGALKLGLRGALKLAAILSSDHTLARPPQEIVQAICRLRTAPAALLEELELKLTDDLPLHARDGGFIRTGWHPDLDEIRKLRNDTHQVISGLQSRYQEDTGIKPLKIKHNNVLGYFIEIPSTHATALTGEESRKRFIHRQTLANQMRFTTSKLSDLEIRIAEATAKTASIEEAILSELTGKIITFSAQIGEVSDAIAAIDVASSLAELAICERYCRPQVDDTLAFSIKEGRHPVVEQALTKAHPGTFVSNDCLLADEKTTDRGLLWLLTGPNMAGKSTFMRQNALIAILAQMGSYVPATTAHIGIIDHLFSRVGAADDLAGGRSTFMVEMVETAAILNQSGPRSFVILDEIGRGTATYDGLAIAWATLEHLHQINQCRTLFATHFHELTALGDTLAHTVNMTMRVSEHLGEVVFLHDVAPGAADRSYGVQVARLAGLPDMVIERASAVLQLLENKEKTANISAISEQLPLFSSPRLHIRDPQAESEVEKRLASLAPDELTPKEALQLIYELRELNQL